MQNDSTLSLDDDILVRLLEMYAAHVKQVEQLEQETGRSMMSLNLGELLNIVLDVLGVPADNTIETDACNIANATGEWPEGSYCRDFWYTAWYNTESGESETTISGFPAWVREQLKEDAQA